MTQNYGKILVNFYGFGNLEINYLIVNQIGEDILQSIGISTKRLSMNIWEVENITILSSLGNEYYLQYKKNKETTNFTLPKIDVLTSLQVEKQK